MRGEDEDRRGWFSIVFLLAAVIGGGVCTGDLLRREELWLYLGFDGILEPLTRHRAFDIKFGATMDELRTGKPSPKPIFVKGVCGQGLDLPAGNLLSYVLDLKGFPRLEGSLVLWFKPHNPLSKTNGFLFYAAWASFAINISSSQMLLYYTSDHRKFLKVDLLPILERRREKWHLLVLSWKAGKRAVYLDGELVAKAQGIPLYGEKYLSPRWDFGFLRPGGARTEPVGFINASIDEFAVLRKFLKEEDAGELLENRGKSLLEFLKVRFVLELPRRVYLRGDKIEPRLRYFGRGSKVKFLALNQEEEYLLEEGRPGEPDSLDTNLLRPGTYILRVDYLDGERLIDSASEEITVRQFRQPQFPLGVGGSMSYGKETLEYLQRNHISFVSSNGPPEYGFKKWLDHNYRYGVALFPNLNIFSLYTRVYEPFKKEPYFVYSAKGRKYVVARPPIAFYCMQAVVQLGGRTEDGLVSGGGSPFSPVAWEMMTARLDRIMKDAGDHPGFQYISFEDERPFQQSKKNSTIYIGDYSYHAIRYFEEKTGLKGPVWPPEAPEGTIFPDSHPYLKWKEIIGMPMDFTTPGIDRAYARLAQEVKKYRPDILVTNYSGAEYGYLDAVTDWRYPYIWSPGLWGGGRGHAYLDFEFDLHRARQRVERKKPLWALLGWWSDDMSKAPSWWIRDFRLNTEIAIAKGVKLIMWFNAGSEPSGFLKTAEGRREFERWTEWLYRYGPFLSELERDEGGNVAVLWSETDRAGKVRKLRPPPRFSFTYTALRLAGAEPYIVTDEDVLRGKLEDYHALVLLDIDYSSESIWSQIKLFASTPGKKVFYGAETSLCPRGSIPLGFSYNQKAKKEGSTYPELNLLTLAEQAHKLASRLPKEFVHRRVRISGSDFVAPYFLKAGSGRMLFLINYDWRRGQRVEVSLLEPPAVLYDLIEGSHLRIQSKGEHLQWEASLPPGGWRVYAILPEKPTRIRLDVVYNAKNHTISLSAQLLGRKKVLPLPLPVSVELLGPDGEILPYTRPESFNPAGRFDTVIQLSNLMDKQGKYTIRLRELVTGLRANERLKVNPALRL